MDNGFFVTSKKIEKSFQNGIVDIVPSFPGVQLFYPIILLRPACYTSAWTHGRSWSTTWFPDESLMTWPQVVIASWLNPLDLRVNPCLFRPFLAACLHDPFLLVSVRYSTIFADFSDKATSIKPPFDNPKATRWGPQVAFSLHPLTIDLSKIYHKT